MNNILMVDVNSINFASDKSFCNYWNELFELTLTSITHLKKPTILL